MFLQFLTEGLAVLLALAIEGWLEAMCAHRHRAFESPLVALSTSFFFDHEHSHVLRRTFENEEDPLGKSHIAGDGQRAFRLGNWTQDCLLQQHSQAEDGHTVLTSSGPTALQLSADSGTSRSEHVLVRAKKTEGAKRNFLNMRGISENSEAEGHL